MSSGSGIAAVTRRAAANSVAAFTTDTTTPPLSTASVSTAGDADSAATATTRQQFAAETPSTTTASTATATPVPRPHRSRASNRANDDVTRRDSASRPLQSARNSGEDVVAATMSSTYHWTPRYRRRPPIDDADPYRSATVTAAAVAAAEGRRLSGRDVALAELRVDTQAAERQLGASVALSTTMPELVALAAQSAARSHCTPFVLVQMVNKTAALAASTKTKPPVEHVQVHDESSVAGLTPTVEPHPHTHPHVVASVTRVCSSRCALCVV